MEGGSWLEVVGLPTGEPAVERDGADSDAPGDLRFRQGALAEQRSGELDVIRIVKLRRRSPTVLVLAVGGNAGAGALRHDLPFHLSEGRDDGENGFADGGLGVDAFAQADQLDLAVVELIDDLNQVGHTAPQPVEAPDDERVAGAQGLEEAVEFGALAAAAGSVVGVDAVAAGILESGDLKLRILVSGGDAGVADAHVTQTPRNIRKDDCIIEWFSEVESGGQRRGLRAGG